MARKKTDKFYLEKGKSETLACVNGSYDGKKGPVTFKDLVDFLTEKKIDMTKIGLPGGLAFEIQN